MFSRYPCILFKGTPVFCLKEFFIDSDTNSSRAPDAVPAALASLSRSRSLARSLSLSLSRSREKEEEQDLDGRPPRLTPPHPRCEDRVLDVEIDGVQGDTPAGRQVLNVPRLHFPPRLPRPRQMNALRRRPEAPAATVSGDTRRRMSRYHRMSRRVEPTRGLLRMAGRPSTGRLVATRRFGRRR